MHTSLTRVACLIALRFVRSPITDFTPRVPRYWAWSGLRRYTVMSYLSSLRRSMLHRRGMDKSLCARVYINAQKRSTNITGTKEQQRWLGHSDILVLAKLTVRDVSWRSAGRFLPILYKNWMLLILWPMECCQSRLDKERRITTILDILGICAHGQTRSSWFPPQQHITSIKWSQQPWLALSAEIGPHIYLAVIVSS